MDIELRNVSFKYKGADTFALSGISHTFKGGTINGVTGRSGSGKSTLFRLLNGLSSPLSGAVLFDGEDINKSRDGRRKALRRVSLLFQNSEDQLFERSVIDDVAFGPLNMGGDREKAVEKAEKALEDVSLGRDKWRRSPFLLSGGEKRKVALAGLLALEGDVLVLDEITSALDGISRREIFSILREKKREGKTIIFSSHNSEEIAEYSESVILLERGVIKAAGDISEVYSYDDEYRTKGARLKTMLEERGLKCGKMDSFSQALSALSSLLNGEEYRI